MLTGKKGGIIFSHLFVFMQMDSTLTTYLRITELSAREISSMLKLSFVEINVDVVDQLFSITSLEKETPWCN